MIHSGILTNKWVAPHGPYFDFRKGISFNRSIMHPTTSELEADLSEAVNFFTNDDIATGLPFMHDFPKNCCEVVTAFLSHTLHKKYPGARVVRVQGEDPLHNEAHFWVEVNDLVIDPTCHQFQSYIKPLVGGRPSPLTERFSKIEEQFPEQAWDALDDLCIDVFMKNEVLNRLHAKFNIERSICS